MSGCQSTNTVNWFSAPTMCILVIKLRLSGLGAGTPKELLSQLLSPLFFSFVVGCFSSWVVLNPETHSNQPMLLHTLADTSY